MRVCAQPGCDAPLLPFPDILPAAALRCSAVSYRRASYVINKPALKTQVLGWPHPEPECGAYHLVSCDFTSACPPAVLFGGGLPDTSRLAYAHLRPMYQNRKYIATIADGHTRNVPTTRGSRRAALRMGMGNVPRRACGISLLIGPGFANKVLIKSAREKNANKKH